METQQFPGSEDKAEVVTRQDQVSQVKKGELYPYRTERPLLGLITPADNIIQLVKYVFSMSI